MAAWLYDRFAYMPDLPELVPGGDPLFLDDNFLEEVDRGELEVGGPRFQFWRADEEDGNDESSDEDWDDGDSGYESLSEEEEEDNDEEEEEMEVLIQGIEEINAGIEEEVEREADDALARFWTPAAPRPPPLGPALNFIPLSGHKRVRDEDDEDPCSKRPCLSSSHPGPSSFHPGPSTSDPRSSTYGPGPSTSDPGPSTSDPRPSTSSGTSGGFRFHHLLQDSDSDED